MDKFFKTEFFDLMNENLQEIKNEQIAPHPTTFFVIATKKIEKKVWAAPTSHLKLAFNR